MQDSQAQQQYADSDRFKTSMDVAFAAYNALMIERLAGLRALAESRFEASQQAIAKADVATELRFQSVNEFRAQLQDQTRTFATKDNVTTLITELRVTVDRMQRDGSALSERVSRSEGKMTAYSAAVAFFVSMLSIALHFIPTASAGH